MNEEDLRNLRNSFFGLIKYYAQKEIKIHELNAIVSFLATTRNTLFQNDLLDMLISLLESPNLSSDQLYLLLFEPNVADGFYALIAQADLVDSVQHKLLKLVRLLLRTKKVYEKSKSRMRLDDCGSYAGLVTKFISEYSAARLLPNSSAQSSPTFSEQLVIDLLENFLLDEATLTSYDNMWHILSLLTITVFGDTDHLIKARIIVCELLIGFLDGNVNAVRLLTKSPGWQDVLCQLFCVEKKKSSKQNGDEQSGMGNPNI